MAKTLPIEMISIILSYLPVISLLRFKSVCKSWLELINSPTFIEEHMSQSKLSKSNRMLVIEDFEKNLYTMDFDTRGSPCVKLPLPEVFNDDRVLKIGGSCNGVVCLYSKAPNSKIILMNASTRHYKVIPVVGRTQFVGLGFDHVNSDFKVFRTYEYEEEVNGDELSIITKQSAVYSSRNDSWRQCDELENTNNLGEVCGVLVESHLLHWIPLARAQRRSIVCFNVCNERWSEVPLPHYDLCNPISSEHYGTKCYFMLGDLEGRLCVWCLQDTNDNHPLLNIWIMKEYGVAESWSPLLGLSTSAITRPFTNLPVTCSNVGAEIIVLDSSTRYDFQNREMNYFVTQGIPKFIGAALCWKTLVGFIGGVPMHG